MVRWFDPRVPQHLDLKEDLIQTQDLVKQQQRELRDCWARNSKLQSLKEAAERVAQVCAMRRIQRTPMCAAAAAWLQRMRLA